MRWAVAGTVLASVLLWFRRHYTAVTVTGLSMQPALQHGDRILVRRVRPGRLRVGDVVVASPDQPDSSGDRQPRDGGDHWLVKRIAALPGDPVPESVRGQLDRALVPAGALVLLGDNPAVSWDSRTLGLFDSESLLGRIVRTLPRSARSRADRLLDEPKIASTRAGKAPRS
jgi:signal peptidase I